MKTLSFLSWLLALAVCAGCSTSPAALSDPDAAKVITQYLGDEAPGILFGPVKEILARDLEVLSPVNQEAVRRLLRGGAVAVMVIDEDPPTRTQPGPEGMSYSKIARVICLQDGRVVGDFWASWKSLADRQQTPPGRILPPAAEPEARSP